MCVCVCICVWSVRKNVLRLLFTWSTVACFLFVVAVVCRLLLLLLLFFLLLLLPACCRFQKRSLLSCPVISIAQSRICCGCRCGCCCGCCCRLTTAALCLSVVSYLPKIPLFPPSLQLLLRRVGCCCSCAHQIMLTTVDQSAENL